MQAVWSLSVSNALWLCADRAAFDSASAVNLPVQAQCGLPYPWPWAWPFLLTSMMRFFCSLGSDAHMSYSWGVIGWGCLSISPLMPLLDMKDAYGVIGKLKLTCELIQWILRDFMREAIRHTCLRVCWVKSLVACRSPKAPFWIPTESTSNSISVSWGSRLDGKPPMPDNRSPVINSCLY